MCAVPINHGPIWKHSSFSPTVTEILLQVVNPWTKLGLHPTITSTMSNAVYSGSTVTHSASNF